MQRNTHICFRQCKVWRTCEFELNMNGKWYGCAVRSSVGRPWCPARSTRSICRSGVWLLLFTRRSCQRSRPPGPVSCSVPILSLSALLISIIEAVHVFSSFYMRKKLRWGSQRNRKWWRQLCMCVYVCVREREREREREIWNSWTVVFKICRSLGGNDLSNSITRPCLRSTCVVYMSIQTTEKSQF